MAPRQLGKFHLLQKAEAVSLHICSVGVGNCVAIIRLSLALQVMCTDWDTVLLPSRYWNARLAKVSPVARNLWKYGKKCLITLCLNDSVTVEDCKRRWKQLRDAYVKYKNKNVPSGSAGGTAGEWKYLSIMSFLNQHLQSRRLVVIFVKKHIYLACSLLYMELKI